MTTDKERLDWVADAQIVEGIADVSLDLHDIASDLCFPTGDEEQPVVDEKTAYRQALRRLIDIAMLNERREMDDNWLEETS